jgi:uncharacterized protein YdaU (DUF1376 family)
MTNKKLPSLPLFTDTFAAETVHLSNEEIGIYIRLLCFAWTKNAKPFTTESAYRICQCKTKDCEKIVYRILDEFFKLESFIDNIEKWTHKRLNSEYDYLINYYNQKSINGKKGGLKRNLASSEIKAHIPIPIHIPKSNNKDYDDDFINLWQSLNIKRGSKYKSFQLWSKLRDEMPSIEETIKIYNSQQIGVEEKFVPHFATWLSQKRWEIEHVKEIPDLIDRLKKLGYIHKGCEGSFEKFSKDGKNYKIDKFDEKHQIQLEQ